VARGECRDAADMIGMFVGNQDRRQRRWLDADPRQACRGVAHAEPAIDQDAGGARFNDQAIAFAAAADRSEAHRFRPISTGP